MFIIIELFSLSFTVETLQAEMGRRLRFSKGVGHFEHRFQSEGASPTNHCCCENSRVICHFMWYQNIHCASFSFLTIHACDRQTLRQTELQLPRAPSHILAQ